MEETKHYLTRRSFVQGTAALGALAALTGCTSGSLTKSDGSDAKETVTEVRHSYCQMCGPTRSGCSTLCYIKDGRWTNVEGNPVAGNNWGRGSRSLCAKGQAAMQTIYDPTRLLYPMRRTGKKGEGKFERCTWDEGIKALADKLKELKDAGTPEAFGVLSPQFWPVLAQMGRRFMNIYGTPNYLHSAICASQRAASKRISIGAGANCYPGQLDKTELLVIWGANPENSEVNQGKPARIVEAKKRGMQLIDIRPMMDQLTSKADIWMPIRPGTDGALALAFLNIIIGEDLFDHDFVENWCSGFDKLAEHVKQFTPESTPTSSAMSDVSWGPPSPWASFMATASATSKTTAIGKPSPCASSRPSPATSPVRAAAELAWSPRRASSRRAPSTSSPIACR